VRDHATVLLWPFDLVRLDRGPELELAQPVDRVDRREPGQIAEQNFTAAE
jgi:hypothetical protein